MTVTLKTADEIEKMRIAGRLAADVLMMIGPHVKAGVIHTDFERGFIRAQTIAFDDFITYKGEAGAKEAGKMRAEGKEYVVKDGDVMNFLFNV